MGDYADLKEKLNAAMAELSHLRAHPPQETLTTVHPHLHSDLSSQSQWDHDQSKPEQASLSQEEQEEGEGASHPVRVFQYPLPADMEGELIRVQQENESLRVALEELRAELNMSAVTSHETPEQSLHASSDRHSVYE